MERKHSFGDWLSSLVDRVTQRKDNSVSNDALINLSNCRIGSKVLFATDEWFACCENLLKPEEPVFDPNAFCKQGKVMDGWESRRKRTPGHDWCIIELGIPGNVKYVDIDTRWFTGNNVPAISIQGIEASDAEIEILNNLPGNKDGRLGTQGTCCTLDEIVDANNKCNKMNWISIVEETPLNPGYEFESLTSKNACCNARITHIRVNYFPDGGVARLRLWGSIFYDFTNDSLEEKVIDLAALSQGGVGLACSNQHYGVPSNLLQPGRGFNMGDGWETARHPHRPRIIEIDPKTGITASTLSDWCVIQLGCPTLNIQRLELDTNHFRGNFPESVTVEAAYDATPYSHDSGYINSDVSTLEWKPLLCRTRLTSSANHVFTEFAIKAEDEIKISHLRVTIFPDGGIMRVRAFGIPHVASLNAKPDMPETLVGTPTVK